MDLNTFKPAGVLAQKLGVKAVIYGLPGSGKTPLIGTAPRPAMLATEPGMLSMRGSNVPAIEAYTVKDITEFFEWFFKSSQVSAFDTLCIDSVSQLAEIVLTNELKSVKDGRMAYGNMSRKVMDWLNQLYFFPNKHILLIAKQASDEGVKRPFFPGQDLNIKVPHMFDLVGHLGVKRIPGYPGEHLAIQTKGDFDTLCRDRSGKLDPFEVPNLSQIFSKCMG